MNAAEAAMDYWVFSKVIGTVDLALVIFGLLVFVKIVRGRR